MHASPSALHKEVVFHCPCTADILSCERLLVCLQGSGLPSPRPCLSCCAHTALRCEMMKWRFRVPFRNRGSLRSSITKHGLGLHGPCCTEVHPLPDQRRGGQGLLRTSCSRGNICAKGENTAFPGPSPSEPSRPHDGPRLLLPRQDVPLWVMLRCHTESQQRGVSPQARAPACCADQKREVLPVLCCGLAPGPLSRGCGTPVPACLPWWPSSFSAQSPL